MDLHPIDHSRELWQRVQSCLALAPVVLSRPVAGERPQRRQLHFLRPILNELFGRPARGREAPAEISEVLTPDIDAEGKNCVGFGRTKRGPYLLRLRACGDVIRRILRRDLQHRLHVGMVPAVILDGTGLLQN